MFLKIFEEIEKELKDLAVARGEEYQDIIEKSFKWSSWANKDWKDKDELLFFVNQKTISVFRSPKRNFGKRKSGWDFSRNQQQNAVSSPILDTIRR